MYNITFAYIIACKPNMICIRFPLLQQLMLLYLLLFSRKKVIIYALCIFLLQLCRFVV